MKSMIRPLMIGVAMAMACIMPAVAQEAPPAPPEATALPEGVVFAAPGPCFVSPDENNIIVWRDGIYDLPSGTKRFDLPDVDLARYSADGRFLIVNRSGLYDIQTGELLIPSDHDFHESRGAEISPNGQLYVDGNAVYDLTTLEQIATLDRPASTGGRYDAYYGSIDFINEGRWLSFDRFDTEHGAWVKVYVDVETWETILDGSSYPPGVDVRFSHDYTRYAIGGQGVFRYPTGEKLFDLPSGFPEFSSDSSVVLVTNRPSITLGPATFTYIDTTSGEEINRFEMPVEAYAYLLPHGLVFEPTMTRTVMPVIAEVGVGENLNPVVRGWQVVEVATGEVLHELEGIVQHLEGENVKILREALGLPTNDRWHVNGRYVIWGEGVFDAETDALIFAQDGNSFSLSSHGTYVYVLNPCTVWELP